MEFWLLFCAALVYAVYAGVPGWQYPLVMAAMFGTTLVSRWVTTCDTFIDQQLSVCKSIVLVCAKRACKGRAGVVESRVSIHVIH